jgi:hypothetical protein
MKKTACTVLSEVVQLLFPVEFSCTKINKNSSNIAIFVDLFCEIFFNFSGMLAQMKNGGSEDYGCLRHWYPDAVSRDCRDKPTASFSCSYTGIQCRGLPRVLDIGSSPVWQIELEKRLREIHLT